MVPTVLATNVETGAADTARVSGTRPRARDVGLLLGRLPPRDSPQLAECGTLETSILLTNTLSVPRVADAVPDWTLARVPDTYSVNPLVGESNDAYLNDIRG